MRHRYAPPRLITELIALTKTWGWTIADLAREIGVDETTLLGYRSGWRALSKPSIRRIARRFGDLKIVRDLTWHHFAVEEDEATSTDSGELALPTLLPKAVAQMQRYVERFAEESIHGGRGLYLVSEEPSALTVAVQQLTRAFSASRIQTILLRADRSVAASEQQAALAAPIVFIERVDFLSDPTSALLHARLQLVRPVVLTSLRAPDALPDARLRRACLAATRTVQLTEPRPAAQPIPPSSRRAAA